MKQFFTLLAIAIFTSSYSQDLSSYMKKYLDEGNKEKIKEIIDLGFNLKEGVLSKGDYSEKKISTQEVVCHSKKYTQYGYLDRGQIKVKNYYVKFDRYDFEKTEDYNLALYLIFRSQEKNRLVILDWLLSNNYLKLEDVRGLSISNGYYQKTSFVDIPCQNKYKKGVKSKNQILDTHSFSIFRQALVTKNEDLIKLILKHNIT